jgi:UDP-3-O-[3-hydroxymyristoyl] N-acetylglucosamine deacetylase
MRSPRRQNTLGRPATVEGFGYWSGRTVRVEFRPAAADTGIVFVRGDVQPAARIPAALQHRIETPRRTTLTAGGARVEMVEHVLAALAGLHVDNCEVWVDQPELPGCDGSSRAFVEAIDAAGIVAQNAPRRQLVVRELIRVGSEESWIEARPATDGELTVRFRIEYPTCPAIGRQTLALQVTPEVFRRELSGSRTFLLKQEAEWLRAQGLASRATSRDVLVMDDAGPIDNELRFPDECVRHKLLDLVGDLALAGYDVVGHVNAHCSGHRLNAELVRALSIEGERIEPRRRSA